MAAEAGFGRRMGAVCAGLAQGDMIGQGGVAGTVVDDRVTVAAAANKQVIVEVGDGGDCGEINPVQDGDGEAADVVMAESIGDNKRIKPRVAGKQEICGAARTHTYGQSSHPTSKFIPLPLMINRSPVNFSIPPCNQNHPVAGIAMT